jgi:hypothetical protein
MTAPITIAFDVACPVEHAFTTWTSDIGSWWPPDHTMTGTSDVEVVLQNRLGGRIFERASDGAEHDWGEVTVWEPPNQLGYRWHLGRDRSDATEVNIRFLAQSSDRTRIEIEHRGWQRLGSSAAEWRERNVIGWDSLLPNYLAAIEKGRA